MDNNKKYRGISGGSILSFVVIVVVILWMANQFQVHQQEMTYTSFVEAVQGKNVSDVYINQNSAVPTGTVSVKLKDEDSTRKVNVSDVEVVEELLKDNGIDYGMSDVPKDSMMITVLFPVLISLGSVFLLFYLMNRQSGGGANSKAMNFGKSRAKMTNQNEIKVTFANVAGLKEEKEELEEIVDFLKSPKKYVQVGARIPKGVLLEGPPGTGKTLLAKAVAGEAGVPFFSISGSDFVEMFVGVGASRVRDLFQDAKKNAPCIVFIDEIDAVARRRGSGLGGGHDEREQTLNQLLVEMDGFGVNEGIIVMAATNRKDILDPAILRPGRFDRDVVVGRPDVGGREEILKVHAKNKPLGDDVDLKQIAQTTAGFSGADLENLLNEAAILAAKENRVFIQQSDIRHAFVKVGIGAEKKSRIVSDKEKRITAYHEAGHAILFHVLPDVGPVYSVSIIPTGGAGGYTMPLPEKDDMFNTKGQMLQEITVRLQPLFIFFLVKEHPTRQGIEKCLQQEVAHHATGIDADYQILLDDECISDGYLRVDEVSDGHQKTGLHHEEQLEAHLRTGFRDNGGSLALRAEESLCLADDEVLRLGECNACQHKAQEQQRGDEVITCHRIRHRVARHSQSSTLQLWMEERVFREE